MATLTEQIYEKIRQDIYMLRLPDHEFLTKTALADRYQVSKAPVREALYRLCREGLMVSYPRRGYRIAMISEEEYEEIRRIRYLNECAAVDLLLKKADRPALEAIAEAAEHTGDVGGNMKFHMSLAAAADNPVLTDIIDRLVTSLARSVSMLKRAGQGRIPVYHQEIAAALMKGDAKSAKEYLKKDIGIEEESRNEDY